MKENIQGRNGAIGTSKVLSITIQTDISAINITPLPSILGISSAEDLKSKFAMSIIIMKMEIKVD